MFLAYSNEAVAGFYISANVMCILLFLIILYKNITGIDRQTKSRFFDFVLVSHIIYYFVEIFWGLFYFEIFPNNPIGFHICNIILFFSASSTSCIWFYYTEALQNDSIVKKLRNRILIYLPVLFSFILDLVLSLCGLGYRVDPNGKVNGEIWYILFMLVPVIYVLLAFIKGFVRANKKENKAFKKEYLMIAAYPLSILFFGVIQIALLCSGITFPILSYGTTIAMIFVYVSSLDNLISLDPLTELNNRNELNKHLYSSFRSIQFEDNLFVIMLDIDHFKGINDKFGHVEGDKALQRIAKCLKTACFSKEDEIFVARYGGDEFIIVAKLVNPTSIIALQKKILDEIKENAQPPNNEYLLTVTLGVSKYFKGESVEDIIKRADDNLYENKQKKVITE